MPLRSFSTEIKEQMLMRRVIVLCLFCWLLVPAAAQTPTPSVLDTPNMTIAAVIEALAPRENSNLRQFHAALQMADPVLWRGLNNPQLAFTVFLPTDAAFEQLFTELGLSAEELFADTAGISALLSVHIIPSQYPYAALRTLGQNAAEVRQDSTVYYGTVLREQALSVTVDETEQVLVNQAKIIHRDVITANGIIHLIDHVLRPQPAPRDLVYPRPTGQPISLAANLATTAAQGIQGRYHQWVGYAYPALGEMLDVGGPYTLFLPTDAAIEQGLAANQINLVDLLKPDLATYAATYTLVPGYFTAPTLLTAAQTNPEGIVLASVIPTRGLLLRWHADTEQLTLFDSTPVNTTDWLASNGVIYITDGLLLPQEVLTALR